MNSEHAILPLVAVIGPTASGKSALGVWLAEQLDGEVVACDSTQLYRGFDIGTAKPAPAERHGVPQRSDHEQQHQHHPQSDQNTDFGDLVVFQSERLQLQVALEFGCALHAVVVQPQLAQVGQLVQVKRR